MYKLQISPSLGRPIRVEEIHLQNISTIEHLHNAIAAKRVADARELADYWLTEFSLSYNYYNNWIPRLADQIAKSLGELVAAEAKQNALQVLVGKDKDESFVTTEWNELKERIRELKTAVGSINPSAVEELVEEIRKKYEILHDVQVAWSCLVLTEISNRLGEDYVEGALRASLRPWIEERYTRYVDPTIPWESVVKDFLLILFESMRCHLSGPRRWGEFDISEEPDRWVLTFDPCGSGCKAMRGGGILPKLTDPPYSAGVSQRPYPWTWCRTGISYYCGHCCLLTEILPIEMGGYPMKITDAPQDPSDPCVWYVYKKREWIPEKYFQRVGKNKPRIGRSP